MAWNPELLQRYEEEMRTKRQAASDAANAVNAEQEVSRMRRELKTAKTRCGALNTSVKQLRAALEEIINSANANPQPIHYKVREAIGKARTILSDLESR